MAGDPRPQILWHTFQKHRHYDKTVDAGEIHIYLASDVGLRDSNRRILNLRRVDFEGCWSSLDSWLREFSTRRQIQTGNQAPIIWGGCLMLARRIQNLKLDPHYVGRMLNVGKKMEHEENLILELRGKYTLRSLYRHDPAYESSELHTLFCDSGTITALDS